MRLEKRESIRLTACTALLERLELHIQRREHVVHALADDALVVLEQRLEAHRAHDHEAQRLLLVEGVSKLLLGDLRLLRVVAASFPKALDGGLRVDEQPVGLLGDLVDASSQLRLALALGEHAHEQLQQLGLRHLRFRCARCATVSESCASAMDQRA